MKRAVRIGALAKELGIPHSTIRFYTSHGFFRINGITKGGQWLYNLAETKKRLKQIQRLKERRRTLEEIKVAMRVK